LTENYTNTVDVKFEKDKEIYAPKIHDLKVLEEDHPLTCECDMDFFKL